LLPLKTYSTIIQDINKDIHKDLTAHNITKIYTKKSSIIITLICILLPKPALASNWVLIGASNEVTNYIDAESILVQGEIKKYWTKKDFKEPQVLEGKIYTQSMTYLQINCSERTLGLISVWLYDSKGKVVNSASLNPIGNQVSIPPNSIADTERKAVCELKK